MLNGDLRKRAIRNFEKAKDQYEAIGTTVGEKSEKLMLLRRNDANELILKAEDFFEEISTLPIEFDKAVAEYKAEYRIFTAVLNKIEAKAREVDIQAGGTAGAGVVAGAGVAAFAPTAAMAIATTFGTASTGTAISALGGAAATNAALAWLGGGAIAAGGGGMAAGNALLALSGPVGWAIGGTALVGSGLFARRKNAKIAEEANEKRKEVEVLIRQFQAALKEIDSLIKETEEHMFGIKHYMGVFRSSATTYDFDEMDKFQIDLLMSIKNNIESLSMLIKKKVNL